YTIFPVNGGNPVNPTQDWAFYPTGGVGRISSYMGGYEMTLKIMTPGQAVAQSERHLNSPQPTDGQILIRSNQISNASGNGISLSDFRTPATNTNMRASLRLQAARFPFNAVNLSSSITGNSYRNEDVNTVNPQFS